MRKRHPDPMDHSPNNPDRGDQAKRLKRHPVNLLALMSGLVFLVIGGGVLIHRIAVEIDAVLVTALTLIAIGAISAATLIARRPRPPSPSATSSAAP